MYRYQWQIAVGFKVVVAKQMSPYTVMTYENSLVKQYKTKAKFLFIYK